MPSRMIYLLKLSVDSSEQRVHLSLKKKKKKKKSYGTNSWKFLLNICRNDSPQMFLENRHGKNVALRKRKDRNTQKNEEHFMNGSRQTHQIKEPAWYEWKNHIYSVEMWKKEMTRMDMYFDTHIIRGMTTGKAIFPIGVWSTTVTISVWRKPHLHKPTDIMAVTRQMESIVISLFKGPDAHVALLPAPRGSITVTSVPLRDIIQLWGTDSGEHVQLKPTNTTSSWESAAVHEHTVAV